MSSNSTRMQMNRRQFLGLAGLAGAAGAATLAGALPKLAFAAGYPERPILFICPWPAGGTADQTMRALCAAASKSLGQSIVVENKAGASGMLGLKAMASAKPDGYTIGQIPISVTRFSQLGTVQVDPMKDLSYIARTSGQTFGSLTGISATVDFTAAPSVVPEPGTWALMNLGFGTAGGILRRRRSEAALTA